MGGPAHVEVLSVRGLSKEERDFTKGKLRCAEPLAAELRPDANAKTVLAQAGGVSADKLPERITWIFGRDRPCFPRPPGTMGQQLEAIDEAARRMAPARGK